MKDVVPQSELIEISFINGTKSRVLRGRLNDQTVYLLSTYTAQGKRKGAKVLRSSIVEPHKSHLPTLIANKTSISITT